MDKQVYSVHQAVDPRHIAAVMEHSERINRKFDSNEVGHTLRDAAIAYVQSYRGTFPYMLTMQARYREHGKLFASQVAGICNCLVADVTRELRQAVRDEKQKQRRRIILKQRQEDAR